MPLTAAEKSVVIHMIEVDPHRTHASIAKELNLRRTRKTQLTRSSVRSVIPIYLKNGSRDRKIGSGRPRSVRIAANIARVRRLCLSPTRRVHISNICSDNRVFLSVLWVIRQFRITLWQ